MTCVLLQVDASIGKSFKCAFRRLLSAHIVKYTENRVDITAEQCPPFKMSKAVPLYDAVQFMKQAWDDVFMPVVFKELFKWDILTPQHNEKIRRLLLKDVADVKTVEKAFEQLCSIFEHVLAETVAKRGQK